MTETTQNASFYDIVKNCKGGLVLNLPAFDSSVQNRRVEIAHNVEKVRVPRVFALGIFTDGTLEKMYKNGEFSIEPAAAFEKEIAEIFFPVENKIPVVKAEEIKKYLIQGNRVKIKELMKTSEVARDTILITARENIGDLSTSMIKDLESILGVELTVENE